MAWYNKSVQGSSDVISSRVRLARNIKGLPFPHKATGDSLKKAYDICRKVYDNSEWMKENFVWLDMSNTPEPELRKLVEKHLISPDLVRSTSYRAAIVSKDEDICIMINEEDHIRLQAISAGFDLTSALEAANKVDDIFAGAVEYGFDDKLGYLTACPTNVGSGMRASVMLHLPLLTENGYISQLINAAGRMGIAVRGMYGEGSKAEGSIYQVSNQITLGVREEELIQRIEDFIRSLVKKEADVRKQVYKTNPTALEDRVWRAYGIMSTARTLTSKELLTLTSRVRIGVDMGIINIDTAKLNELLVTTAPAHIAALCRGEAKANARDVKRAEYVRREVKINDVQ